MSGFLGGVCLEMPRVIMMLIDAEYGGYVEQPYLTRLCMARKSG